MAVIIKCLLVVYLTRTLPQTSLFQDMKSTGGCRIIAFGARSVQLYQ